MGLLIWITIVLVLSSLLYLYIRLNDAKLMHLPDDVAAAFSPNRWTEEDVRKAAACMVETPITIDGVLPPPTGRRYIVIGGAGFLGGWIVCHLLHRGEDPKRIRVLDLRLPTRADLTTGRAKDVDFKQVDISDKAAVEAMFRAPWPDCTGTNSDETTVFHTAANIRFYERHPALQHLSDNVNVLGTQNIIDAARSIGASVLVSTSSGSISVRRTRFWLWPWQKQPEFFVQPISDDDAIIPKRHEHFFSNYAASKAKAEQLVRGAHGTPSGSNVLRTGAIRPGNGIFGPGGDIMCAPHLKRRVNPTWIGHVLQSFVYVENVSLAHLCFEQRLLEAERGSAQVDIGGQAFSVSDAGPPVTFGDVFTALSALTDGRVTFPTLSATGMLLVAHTFELQHLARHFALLSPYRLVRALGRLVPRLNGDLINLQPPMYALTMVHLIWDNSRALAAPEKGGLGYAPPWTTLEGLCKLVDEHNKAGRRGEERSLGGGVSVGFASSKAVVGVEKVIEGLGVEVMVKN